jgi:glucose-6-phosphate 1-dehydrogenase
MASNVIVVIFGVTGDLSTGKLIPALVNIHKKFRSLSVIGVSRNILSDQQLEDVQSRLPYFEHCVADSSKDDLTQLSSQIWDIRSGLKGNTEILYYLAIPPNIAMPILRNLSLTDCYKQNRGKLLIEKPFGLDRTDANDKYQELTKLYKQKDLYLVDHFLHKPYVAKCINILTDYPEADRVEITANYADRLGPRSNFYEQTGAIRDVLQNHLLCIAGNTLIDTAHTTSYKRANALQKLNIFSTDSSLRRQYTGYRVDVDCPNSNVETYVEATSCTDEPKIVSYVFKTGKACAADYSSVRLFQGQKAITEIAPMPSDSGGYESVFMDAVAGNHDRFVEATELDRQWQMVQPLIDAWADNPVGLEFY